MKGAFGTKCGLSCSASRRTIASRLAFQSSAEGRNPEVTEAPRLRTLDCRGQTQGEWSMYLLLYLHCVDLLPGKFKLKNKAKGWIGESSTKKGGIQLYSAIVKCSSFWAVTIAMICWKEHGMQKLAYGCLSGLWSALSLNITSWSFLITTSGIKYADCEAMKDCTPNSVVSWFLHLPCMAFLCHWFCYLPPPHPFCHEPHGCVNCKQEVTGTVEVLTYFSQRNKVSMRRKMLK